LNDTDILVCLGKLKVLLKKIPLPATPNPPNILLPPQLVIKCFALEFVYHPYKLKLSANDKTYIGFVITIGIIGGYTPGKQFP